MRSVSFFSLVMLCGVCGCSSADLFGGTSVTSDGSSDVFHAPVRLESQGEAIRVESPGYAAPCWADVDNDGMKDLLVGQFNQGKIRVFKNLGDCEFAAGTWLEAEGSVAEVPGVW